MTVEHARTIDWLGLQRDPLRIFLAIADHLDWSDEHGHLYFLQEKLNTYIAFIESGEVFSSLVDRCSETVPETTPIVVKIMAKYPMSVHAKTFFDHALRTLSSAGVDLSFELVADD